MKRYKSWLMIPCLTAGLSVQAEMVITSPTATADESDVVLEKIVDAVKAAPSDTAGIVSDTAGFAADEIRNTAHGVRSALKGPAPRETAHAEMMKKNDAAWDSAGAIRMRTYEVTEKAGKEMSANAAEGASVIDVRSFFMGIDFPEGTSACYRPEFRKLIVHQTAANLRAMDALMAGMTGDPDYRQVEIQTRFVEAEQKSLKELGFDWNFNDDWQLNGNWTAGLAGQTLDSTLRTSSGAFNAAAPGTMTLTKDGWLPLELAIRALEQSGQADMLSAPAVTTLDGKTAEIWVGDRENLPTKFQAASQNTSVFIEYDSWEEMNIGVHLKVTPEVVEKGIIRLELEPQVLDLEGFDTYEITPDNANMLVWAGQSAAAMTANGRYPIPNVPGMDSVWNLFSATLGGADPNNITGSGTNRVSDGYYDNDRAINHEEYGVPVPRLDGSLPFFCIRKIKTNLVVSDGSTVGMGGLIYNRLETYKDKVPVLGSIPLLGRLFRSEGERSVKRNLMIFVTATQVDVNGRRAADLALKP